ncbi:hypothetical protein ACFQ1S_27140, partial [Kibdelosporangium lantanae]
MGKRPLALVTAVATAVTTTFLATPAAFAAPGDHLPPSHPGYTATHQRHGQVGIFEEEEHDAGEIADRAAEFA